MAATKPVPNVMRLDFGWTLNGIIASTRMFFSYATGTAPTVASCNAWIGSARTSYNAQFKNNYAPSTVLQYIKATDLSSPTGATAVDNTQSVGGSAGTAAPASSCIQINYLINNRYRGGKPRGFWPGTLAQDTADAQHWKSTIVTEFQTAILNMVSTMLSTSQPPSLTSQVAVHYYKSWIPNPHPSVWGSINVPKQLDSPTVDVVTAPLVMGMIGTQRGRLRS